MPNTTCLTTSVLNEITFQLLSDSHPANIHKAHIQVYEREKRSPGLKKKKKSTKIIKRSIKENHAIFLIKPDSQLLPLGTCEKKKNEHVYRGQVYLGQPVATTPY